MIQIHCIFPLSSKAKKIFDSFFYQQLLVVLTLILIAGEKVLAQEPGVAQTIEIMSSYKPMLRPVSKLFFTASPIPPSPFSTAFAYRLPDQQYRVAMKPLETNPFAFISDSLKLRNHHSLSLGYGNFNRLVVEGATAGGAGKPFQYQVQAGYHAEEGTLRLQKSNRAYASVDWQHATTKHRQTGRAGYRHLNYFFYGNDSLTKKTPSDSLRRPFDLLELDLGWTNHRASDKALRYHPELHFEMFSAARTTEWNTRIRAPFSIDIRPLRVFSLQLEADLTHFQTTDTARYQNHIFSVDPSFRFPFRDMHFMIGGRAVWDQGNFLLLPNIGLEAFVKNQKAVLMAGWNTVIQKNNYRNITSINPWINRLWAPQNTRIETLFLGVRGDLPFRMHYRLQGGLTRFHNQVLYLNVKRASFFELAYEDLLQTIHVSGEANWKYSDRLSASMDAVYYHVTDQQTFVRPWHFIPFQANVSAYWKPAKNWLIQMRIYGWDGPVVLNDTLGNAKKLPIVVDANLQTEYKINTYFTAWLQGNNLFNQAYQRWNQYPVLGFQIVGGIRLTFDSK